MSPPVERFRLMLKTIWMAHSVRVMMKGVKPRERMLRIRWERRTMSRRRKRNRLFLEK